MYTPLATLSPKSSLPSQEKSLEKLLPEVDWVIPLIVLTNLPEIVNICIVTFKGLELL